MLRPTVDVCNTFSNHAQLAPAIAYTVAAASGVNITGIGGYSTRPNADFLWIGRNLERCPLGPVVEGAKDDGAGTAI